MNPKGTAANLLPGGLPGNRGGGNISNEVRAILAKGVREAAPAIIEIAKGRKHKVKVGDIEVEVRSDSASEQVAAFTAVLKGGIGELKGVSLESADWLAEIAEETADFFSTWEIPKERYDQWFQQCVQDRLKQR